MPVGQVITATATQLISGPGSVPLNTSEFSAPRAVSLRPTNVAVGSGDKLGKVAIVNLVAGNVVNSTSFSPFGKFKGEIHVANADFNGDGVNDFVVAQGKDGQAIVRVLNGTDPTGGTQLFQVAAYPSKFHGGVNVAAADVDGDGVPELITAPDSGKQPVEVFSGVGAHALLFTLSPFGATFTDGVRVAAGDVNGDGRADIITGVGPSMIGPRSPDCQRRRSPPSSGRLQGLRREFPRRVVCGRGRCQWRRPS